MNQAKTTLISHLSILKVDYIFIFSSFLIPFLITGPQLLTGSLVNALLYLAVLKIDRKNLFFVAAIPSLATISHGVLFGSLTPFLIYFLPFIWIGNLVLMNIFINSKKIFPFLISVVLASISKTLILYFAANIYFGLHLVPQIFIKSMGIIQLTTALTGGITTFILFKFISNPPSRNSSVS